MQSWKFSCESRSEIPLPPAYTFPQAFNYLNSEKNSFYILEHESGSYMQCGGSKGACCVELRICDPAGSHRHYVIGNSTGDESPATIQMSGGAVSVLRREVLTHWEAIALFKRFFAGEQFPTKYSLREVAL